MENFILYEKLSETERSVLYKGRKKNTSSFLSIQCVEKSKKSQLTNMVRLVHKIRHENIMRFFEWYETSKHFWTILELCSGTNLDTILKQDHHLPEEMVRSVALDVLSALHFLHSLGILCCDIQPAKIHSRSNGRMCISDLTLGRLQGEDIRHVFESFHPSDERGEMAESEYAALYDDLPSSFNYHGHPNYLSPQLINGACHTAASDLWAVGCLLYQMYTGFPPFLAESFSNLAHKINTYQLTIPRVTGVGWIPSVQANQVISQELSHLILNLLMKEEEERLAWNDLIDHDFFGRELVDRITFKHDEVVDVEMQTQQLLEKQQQQIQQQLPTQQQLLLQPTLQPKKPTFSILKQHNDPSQQATKSSPQIDKQKENPSLKKLHQPGSLLKQRAEKPTQHQMDFLPQRFMQHNQNQSIIPEIEDEQNGFSDPCFTKVSSDMIGSWDGDTLRQTIRDSIINFKVVKQEDNENNNETKPGEMYPEKLKKQKSKNENENIKIAWQQKETTIKTEKITPQNLQLQNSQQQKQLQLSQQKLQHSQHLPLEQLSKRNTKTKSTFSFRSRRREEDDDEEEIPEEIICDDDDDDDDSVKSDMESSSSEDSDNSIVDVSWRAGDQIDHNTTIKKVDAKANEEDGIENDICYQDDSDNETLGIIPCGDDDTVSYIGKNLQMRDSYIESLLRTKNNNAEKPKRSKTFNIKKDNHLKIIQDTKKLSLHSDDENKNSLRCESGKTQVNYVGHQLGQVAGNINSYLLHSSDLKEYPIVFVVQNLKNKSLFKYDPKALPFSCYAGGDDGAKEAFSVNNNNNNDDDDNNNDNNNNNNNSYEEVLKSAVTTLQTYAPIAACRVSSSRNNRHHNDTNDRTEIMDINGRRYSSYVSGVDKVDVMAGGDGVKKSNSGLVSVPHQNSLIKSPSNEKLKSPMNKNFRIQTARPVSGSNLPQKIIHLINYIGCLALEHKQCCAYLVEKNVCLSLCVILKDCNVVELQVKILQVMMVLFSGVSKLHQDTNVNEVLTTLVTCAKSRNENIRLRNHYLPCVGLVLLLLARSENDGQVETPPLTWLVPPTAFNFVAKCLFELDDSRTLQCALNIVENVALYPGQHSSRFCTSEVIGVLWSLYSHSTSQSIRASAICALLRLSCLNSSYILSIVTKHGPMVILASITARKASAAVTPRSSHSKLQQFSAALLLLLLSSNESKNARLQQDETIIKCLLRSPTAYPTLVTSKLYVCLKEVINKNHQQLVCACENRLLNVVEKELQRVRGREGSVGSYHAACFQTLLHSLLQLCNQSFDKAGVYLDSLGRRGGLKDQTCLKSCLSHLLVLQTFLDSESLLKLLLEDHLMMKLCNLLNNLNNNINNMILNSAWQQNLEEILNNLIGCTEFLLQQPLLIAQYFHDVINHFLPALLELSRVAGKTSGFIYQVFCTILIIIILNRQGTFSQEQLDQLYKNFIRNHFIAVLSPLTASSDASFNNQTIKLLLLVLEKYPDYISDILNEEFLSIIISLTKKYKNDVMSSSMHHLTYILKKLLITSLHQQQEQHNHCLKLFHTEEFVDCVMFMFKQLHNKLQQFSATDRTLGVMCDESNNINTNHNDNNYSDNNTNNNNHNKNNTNFNKNNSNTNNNNNNSNNNNNKDITGNTNNDEATTEWDSCFDLIFDLLEIFSILLKDVSDFVKTALNTKRSRSEKSPRISRDAENLLSTYHPSIQLSSPLIQLLVEKKEEVASKALRCLTFLIQFYGAGCDDTLCPKNKVILSTYLVECDMKKKKIILRLIKRLATSNEAHASSLRHNSCPIRRSLQKLFHEASYGEGEGLKEQINELLAL